MQSEHQDMMWLDESQQLIMFRIRQEIKTSDHVDVRTCCGFSESWLNCSPSGEDDVEWLRYSFHHRDTNCSMMCEWLSPFWLPELQGFIAPKKWTIFALWPNLQEQNDPSWLCRVYIETVQQVEGKKKDWKPQSVCTLIYKLYTPL